MLKQNYDIMCELDLCVNRGLVMDQDTGIMVKNNTTGKYLIVRIDDSYVDWRYYEEFNPYLNFKQLKSLVEWYLNKLSIEEGRYFQIFASKTTETQIALVVKGENEEVSSRYFDKDKQYLCYIDLIYALNGDYDADMSMFMEDRDQL